MTSRIVNKNLNTKNLIERFPLCNRNYLPSNNKCKDLVVYGSNLASTVGYPTYTIIVRHMVNIPSLVNSSVKYELESILVGILISDGWLEINKLGNTRFFFKQSMNKSEFIFFVFNRLSHFCSSYPMITTTSLKDRNFKGLCFNTRAYPCLTEFYYMFYVKRTKIVPLNLYEIIDYEFLAYWVMGDGTKAGNAIYLQTQTFTVEECVLIISILIHKFNLNCNIHMQRKQPTIYISAKSIKQIKAQLLPYFVPSMFYKLNL